MKSWLALPFAIAVTVAGSSPSDSLSDLPERGKALLIAVRAPGASVGSDVPWTRVIFVKLDDAAVPSQTILSVQPGHHTLDVNCEITLAKTIQVLPGVDVFDVEADMAYDVVGSLNNGGRYCNVGLVKRS